MIKKKLHQKSIAKIVRIKGNRFPKEFLEEKGYSKAKRHAGLSQSEMSDVTQLKKKTSA